MCTHHSICICFIHQNNLTTVINSQQHRWHHEKPNHLKSVCRKMFSTVTVACWHCGKILASISAALVNIVAKNSNLCSIDFFICFFYSGRILTALKFYGNEIKNVFLVITKVLKIKFIFVLFFSFFWVLKFFFHWQGEGLQGKKGPRWLWHQSRTGRSPRVQLFHYLLNVFNYTSIY